ncbi:hypothetical protein BCR33DRAFT_247486 [Rhizoclosmatium globosum]|uniref:Uncharacterized protein n=1 Tax=Rhizoclosmatium globosum TaxID=329046 RepID=A0A1Y2C9Q6_9FUNG|nr:hypothetical protein BCR33DRAFT_247486 [Rhizoclosmatium globosum]|eukprot:ORY43759.1 hypothetical protein BCR33DRAFT_247486 [Rhizoclosmatium globosum]
MYTIAVLFTLVLSVVANRQHYHHKCSTFGEFSCSDDWKSLMQCSYVEGNVLAWRYHSHCPRHTNCVDMGPNGYVGCEKMKEKDARDSKGCAFGAFMCDKDGLSLWQCAYADNGTLTWVPHSKCKSGEMCVVNGAGGYVGCMTAVSSRDTPVCTFGAWMCAKDGMSLMQCDYVKGSLGWKENMKCKSGTQCVANGPNGYVGCQKPMMTTTPGVPACKFGAFMCAKDGVNLMQCDYVNGNLAWKKVLKCKKGKHCIDNGPNGYVGCK